MEKHKWYIEIIFKSGVRQKGYHECYESESKKVSDSFLEIGKSYVSGTKVFNSMYINNTKNSVVTFDTRNIDAMIISDKPIVT